MKIAIRRQLGCLGSRIRPRLLRGFGCLLFSLPTTVSAQAQFEFDISGNQILSQALIQFSHQSGLAIVFPDRLTRDIPTTALIGEMSSEAALRHLLANTELDYQLIDNRIIAVYDARCEITDSCPAPEQMLIRNPLYVPGIEEIYVYGSQITGSRIRQSNLARFTFAF